MGFFNFNSFWIQNRNLNSKSQISSTKDAFYDDFNMDETDLSIEKYEVLFGDGYNDPEHLFAKDGIDSLFGAKETSVAESMSHNSHATKVIIYL